MWSSARYKPHSELTKQSKTKRQSNFLQKTRAFDLKIQKLAAVLNDLFWFGFNPEFDDNFYRVL